MTILLDKNLLYTTFNISSFYELESSIQNIAPSMVEYYLHKLSQELLSNVTYINRSNIQNTIYIDTYTLHYDYNDDIYIEFQEKEDDYETQSLW